MGAINIAYELNENSLELHLGTYQLIQFKFFEWFFLTKGHLFLLYILCVIGYDLIFLESVGDIGVIILTFIFMLFHLSRSAIDRLNSISFSELKKILKEDIEKYDKSNKEIELDFIVYTEDKDFHERNSPIFSFFSVIKRKIKTRKKQSVSKKNNIPLRKKIKNYMLKFYKNRDIYKLMKDIFFIIKLAVRYLYRKIKRLLSRIRGYSTIQQQIVRTNAMAPDSYKYTIRRKIYIEWIYTSAFFKAVSLQVERYAQFGDNDFKEKENLIKVYVENKNILNGPKNMEEVKLKMAKNSRLGILDYEKLYKEYKTNK